MKLDVKFCAEVATRFKKAKPGSFPHDAIFAVAKKHGMTVKVSNMDETFLKKNAVSMMEDENKADKLENGPVTFGKERVMFDWIDECRVVFY